MADACRGAATGARTLLALAWLAGVLVCPWPARASSPEADEQVRAPAVAGTFYPSDAAKLKAVIETYLSRAAARTDSAPAIVIAPHAGYTFSGQIAADAYAQVAGRTVDTVVILGTNHTVPGFKGVALYRGQGFRTPLGVAAIDTDLAAALSRLDSDVRRDDEPHVREHSIEVHVPFVQHLWPKARVLPLVVGEPDLDVCERLGRALASLAEGRRLLIVASSDLSHYAAADEAARADDRFLDAVKRMDPAGIRKAAQANLDRGVPGLVTSACGEAPILAAVSAARAMGATHAEVVSRATSADSPLGERGRTVGYAAVVFSLNPKKGASNVSVPTADGPMISNGPRPLTAAEGAELVSFARETIAQYLQTGTAPLPRTANLHLQQPLGTFVTLRRKGELRGCIGRIVSPEPLLRTVGLVALGAALQDPRFPPVQPAELPSLEVEVSVLSPLRVVGGVSEIEIGRDGVVLEKNGRSAVFLPEVAPEEGWTRDQMLDQLCEKAGLLRDCWRGGARLQVFQSQKFSEGRTR